MQINMSCQKGQVCLLTALMVTFIFAAVAKTADQKVAADQAPAATVVPRLVRFGGALKDAGGKPMTGAQDVTFSLYTVEAGGEPLWFETQTVEADAQGRYTALLGAMHPDGLPMDSFTSGEARWLGVSVGKLPEQARVLLVAVPYALKAADADTLGGKAATEFVLSGELKNQVHNEVKTQATQSGEGQGTRRLVGTAPSPQALGEGQSSFICALAADCVLVTQSGSGVGLHATTPTGNSVLGELSGTSGAAVYGRATAGTGVASAVQGDSASTAGVGVLGRAFATTGVAKGIFGRSFSTSGIGVHGDATTATGATRGVWGTTVSSSGVGVYGQSSAGTGLTTGVTGTVASTAGIGVLGQANAASGATTGVLAKVLSGSGTALVADNTVGGKIISGRVNGVEKFNLSGAGNLNISGAMTATSFTGSGAGLTNVDAVTLGGFLPAAFAPATGSSVYVAKAGDTMTGTLNLPANGLVAGTNQLVISGGNVGVGTATPLFKLDVGGRGNFIDSLTTVNTAVVYATHTGLGVPSPFPLPTDIAAAAIRGDATAAATNVTHGVVGTSNGTKGRGVTGIAWSATGNGRGVSGFSYASGGIGALGAALATTGFAVGVYGESDSPGGVAGVFSNLAAGQILSGDNGTNEVFSVMNNGDLNAAGTVTAAAFSGSGAGLTGVNASTAATATNAFNLGGVDAAIFARRDAANNFVGGQHIDGDSAGILLQVTQAGTGDALQASTSNATDFVSAVHGEATATSGATIAVQGRNHSSSDNAIGVSGEALGTSGVTIGVEGSNSSTTNNASAVRGEELATTGANFGVLGQSASSTGMGVRGEALSTTGINVGVHGETQSSGGVGVQGYANDANATAGLFDNKGGGKILSGRNNNTEIFSVEGNGDVTTTSGDARVLGAGKGIILKSPNGSTCARISIDNAGSLVTSVITCP